MRRTRRQHANLLLLPAWPLCLVHWCRRRLQERDKRQESELLQDGRLPRQTFVVESFLSTVLAQSVESSGGTRATTPPARPESASPPSPASSAASSPAEPVARPT